MSRPKFTCNGHDGLTVRKLASHDRRDCSGEDTRDARNRMQRIYSAIKRGEAWAETAGDELYQTSAEGQHEEVEEGRGTAETRSEPAHLLDETAAPGSSPASAEPDPDGEVGDATTAHDAPEVAQRPASPAAPKPAPPAVASTISSQGASRRLRALTTFGYTPRMLHKVTGLSEDSVWWLLTAPPESIQVRTHRAVVDAFKLLRVTPLVGPDADRSRALALRNEWPGPYDWDDIDADGKAPHHSSHKAWDAIALADAINAAKLEQGDPEAYSTDAVLDARGEAGRLRVELERTTASYEQLRSTAAAAIGEVDGLRERVQRRDGEILALRDQLEAARDERDRHSKAADVASRALEDAVARLNTTKAQADTDADIAADRIRELEDALAAGTSTEEPTAPVRYLRSHSYTEPDTMDLFVTAPALAAEVSITIERTERGVSIAFPASLIAEGGR